MVALQIHHASNSERYNHCFKGINEMSAISLQQNVDINVCDALVLKTLSINCYKAYFVKSPGLRIESSGQESKQYRLSPRQSGLVANREGQVETVSRIDYLDDNHDERVFVALP